MPENNANGIELNRNALEMDIMNMKSTRKIQNLKK
jgi:hypothetical protein